ncbi:hypothetical protein H6F86_22045 [Phormidium sp. FACHB-592]|uniref:Uncharacterized protein n=1 Tax=Stenomitos frigidus AS-A4 TaxID=2933935 RepID=A0ABV0KF88_9CYAN|nr:hypothetical protein [Phormidium sp. FACHB-592]MBD2076518.1 hypothetical protein [Phormidium sp. FACHB-592]
MAIRRGTPRQKVQTLYLKTFTTMPQNPPLQRARCLSEKTVASIVHLPAKTALILQDAIRWS